MEAKSCWSSVHTHHGFAYEVSIALTLCALVFKLVSKVGIFLLRRASSGPFGSEGICAMNSLSLPTRFFHLDKTWYHIAGEIATWLSKDL